MSIKELLTKILKRLNLAPVYTSGTVTVNAAQNYTIATITLPANGKYLILANTVEGVASDITSICRIDASNYKYVFGNGYTRTRSDSGQGVMAWRYVETGSTPGTVSVGCYGYYTTSHSASGWIIGIPIAGGGTI